MAEQPNRLLTAVTQFESAAFRAGVVARRLQAAHPDLTAYRVACCGYGIAYAWDTDPSTSARLEVRAEDLDGLQAWAAALGTTALLKTQETNGHVYETGDCTADIDGVTVEVTGSRVLSADEAAAWHAEQAEGGDV